MEFADLIKSGAGAVVGFTLAQLVSLAAIIRKWKLRPKLEIQEIENALLLSHTSQISASETAEEMYFGFKVKNAGRTIATGVRFQIIGIKFREGGQFVDYLGDMALDLSVYRGAAGSVVGPKEITLVPSAAVNIALAWWREDYECVRPCIENAFDYYDEMADNKTEYEFAIVAFDDAKNLATATIKVDRLFRTRKKLQQAAATPDEVTKVE